MDSMERDVLVEHLIREQVDQWDMDALIDYAVEQIFENMEEAEDEELATMWEQVIGDETWPKNPFRIKLTY